MFSGDLESIRDQQRALAGNKKVWIGEDQSERRSSLRAEQNTVGGVKETEISVLNILMNVHIAQGSLGLCRAQGSLCGFFGYIQSSGFSGSLQSSGFSLCCGFPQVSLTYTSQTPHYRHVLNLQAVRMTWTQDCVKQWAVMYRAQDLDRGKWT